MIILSQAKIAEMIAAAKAGGNVAALTINGEAVIDAVS